MRAKKNKPVLPSVDSEIVRRVRSELDKTLRQLPVPGTCKTRQPLSFLSYCGRKTVVNSEFCYWHLPNTQKYSPLAVKEYFGDGITVAEALENEVKAGASLEGCFLQDCQFGGDFLRRGPCLSGGKFTFANFRGASMSESDLSSASFVGADLTKAKLSSCVLSGTIFNNARLFETKFRDNNLKDVKGIVRSSFRGPGTFGFSVDRILEEYPEQAAPMYRELVSYFSAHGLLEDASWAAYRASVLQHQILKKEFSWNSIRAKQVISRLAPQLEPVTGSLYFEFIRGFVRWAKSGIFLLVTGYGERPMRVVIATMLLILGYAALYATPGAITGHGFSNALYFSIITFTTLGYGDMLPLGRFRLVAGSEALCGILCTGLFLFCIGRKTVSRG